MNSPLHVGVTGGIGSGKSLICRIFTILGIPVYSADSRAKWLMTNDEELTIKVREIFGNESYKEGKLNRKYLAARTFNDPQRLDRLNQLVHPAVKRDYEQWHLNQVGPYVIREAALLIETKSYKTLDYLINVYASEELRIKRVLARDTQRDINQIKDIISRQVTDAKRKEKADRTIVNDDSRLVIPQVLEIDNLLRGRR